VRALVEALGMDEKLAESLLYPQASGLLEVSQEEREKINK
jgi:hypothetical protein